MKDVESHLQSPWKAWRLANGQRSLANGGARNTKDFRSDQSETLAAYVASPHLDPKGNASSAWAGWNSVVRTRLFALRPTRMVVRTPSSDTVYLCFQQIVFTPLQRQRPNSRQKIGLQETHRDRRSGLPIQSFDHTWRTSERSLRSFRGIVN
jgi:hypothetical protein